MKYTREELVKMSEIYFSEYDISVIYASEDGNFFLPQNKKDADAHSGSNGFTQHVIVKVEAVKVEVKKVKKLKEIKEDENNLSKEFLKNQQEENSFLDNAKKETKKYKKNKSINKKNK